MTKLLKMLFIVLLIVTVAEAGYYVYIIKFQGPVTTPSPGSLEKRETMPSGPVTTPFIYEPDILEETRNRVIDEEHKVSIQIDDIGIVDEVTQNYSDSYNRTAELYLSIAHKRRTQDPNNFISHSKYFFNKKDITISIVSPDGQKKDASITDIKQGDAIVVNTIISIIDFKTKKYIYSYSIEITK